MKVALTIAGSDSGGGAGIQADLKTFSAFGVFGTSAITAITAQNTQGVTGIEVLSPEIVAAQIDAVAGDFPIASAKTGMLANAEVIAAVSDRVESAKVPNLVVDPVMVAKSGDKLLEEEAVSALVERILPLAHIVTPNLPEAEVLVGHRIEGEATIRDAAKAIRDLGPSWVVIKGGHAAGEAVDWVYDGSEFHPFEGERIQTTSTHGTGCTFSAAIAACLALGMPPLEAIGEAKQFVSEAIKYAPGLGKGHGPLNHLCRMKFGKLDA